MGSMVGISKMRGCPPLASSETLYSSSMGTFEIGKERKMKMMTWEQFKRLDPECKNVEIRRMLPMISNMSEDISTINKDMNFARGRLDELRNNLENNRKSNAKQDSY